MGVDELRKYGKRRYELLDAIRGRLAVERARDDSDQELDRCLSQCIRGDTLVPIAKQLRDNGCQLSGYYPEPEPSEKGAFEKIPDCDYFNQETGFIALGLCPACINGDAPGDCKTDLLGSCPRCGWQPKAAKPHKPGAAKTRRWM